VTSTDVWCQRKSSGSSGVNGIQREIVSTLEHRFHSMVTFCVDLLFRFVVQISRCPKLKRVQVPQCSIAVSTTAGPLIISHFPFNTCRYCKLRSCASSFILCEQLHHSRPKALPTLARKVQSACLKICFLCHHSTLTPPCSLYGQVISKPPKALIRKK
jgi:hypothetical protein